MGSALLVGITLEEVIEIWGEPRLVHNPLRENKYTEVYVIDEPGAGGACHEYIIVGIESQRVLEHIRFQKGPIGENGVNGIQIEDLSAINIHRLEGFQSGDYACRENELAKTDFESGTLWLNKRTAERERRMVEGTSKK